MEEYKYTANNDNIAIIENALKTCSIGIGLSILCNIDIKRGELTSTIIFKTKEKGKDKQINPMEFFAFGLMIGTDYMK